MQLRKYFRSDSAPQERRGLFSSPFVKRKGSDNYATIIPLEERQPIKQQRSRDKRHYLHRNDSHNSISSNSTADSQEHSRQGSVKSVKLEAVAIAGNIVESPVEVHQVDNDDGTLTKDKTNVSMEAVTNCFDDILKHCDDETIERKCDCPKKTTTTSPPNVTNENEINNHNKHNTNKNNCENCGFSGKCGKEDNNRNSIHRNSGAVTRLSSASTGSGGSLQSPDDKTLTKDSQQHVDNNSTTDKAEVNSETPKIESFMLNKTVESELKCEPPACDSPDLGVDDTSPTGMFLIQTVPCSALLLI